MTPSTVPAPASANGHRDESVTRAGGPASDGHERREGRSLGRVGRALAGAARKRIPVADLDERDPDFIRDNLPWLWLLASIYYRGEVRGLAHIPETGPVLLVSNHSGGNMTPDTGVFTIAFAGHFGVERHFYQLAHNLVVSWPGLGILRKLGAIAASPENARRALESGAVLLVYPGGDHEVHRPTWESTKIDFDRREGFLRLALELDVPLVPVVAIGGQETALFLSRGEGLARFLKLDRMFRLKVLPISIALPWGLNVGDFFGHLPLPAKITVEVLPAINLRQEFGPEPDIDEVYEYVTRAMQDTLDGLAAERQLPILG